jgi:hypothetical protein
VVQSSLRNGPAFRDSAHVDRREEHHHLSTPSSLRTLARFFSLGRSSEEAEEGGISFEEEKATEGYDTRPFRSVLDTEVDVQPTISKGQGCRYSLFDPDGEAGGAPARGAAGLGSPGTAEQRHQRDRMRHGRTRTMRR